MNQYLADETISTVGNIPAPIEYRGYWTKFSFHFPKPVGIDPETGEPIFWGDGHRLTSDINDTPTPDDIPF